MKKNVILILLFVFSFASMANAQNKGDYPKKDKGAMLDKMKEKLSLTDQQVSQIKAIDAKYENEEEALEAKMKSAKDEYRALREKKKAEINKVLTTEQQAKIQEWKKEHKDKRGKHKMQKDKSKE